MENSSYNLTWEDGTVIQTEEVITEEFIEEVNGEFEENIVNNDDDELVEEVGVIETEVVEEVEENMQQQEVSLEVEHDGTELVYLADDGNILVMNEHQYHEDQLMGVTEEIITDNWDTSCPEEIIIGSEEAISSSGTLTAVDDEDIILPTDQDEYTAARPYPCDFCSRRFRKKVNLMNHMVAHQTDRPHGCNLCGVRYVRKADLMNHLKSHAYIPDSEQNELSDDDNNADQSFGNVKPPRRKNRAYGKRKKKRLVKVEYENLFTNDDAASSHANNFEEYPETEEIRYIEGEEEEEEEDNKDYSTSQGVTKYPVTDSRKPFVCQHCGVGFGREKALASHSRVHAGDSPFECQKCGEMFWDINLMQSHAREKHGEIQYDDDDEDDDYSESDETKYGTFYCSTCGLSFHRQDNLRRHQRIHIKEEFLNEQDIGHICNVCGESFPEALDLLAHAEVHARGSEHRCMLCGEICIDENTLGTHVQTEHKNLPPNTCALCGRTCKDNRSLLKHSWEHSKEKTFGCSKCSKTFHNKARLKRHMLSHRSKVVTCAVCGEDFPDGRSLMNHRHSHSSVSGRQFPCKDCGKTFGSRSSQQIHVRIHTGERPYGCRFCWKAFADGGTLRKHERIHTGEKPYACAVCPRAFNQRVVLREHIRSHHSGPDPKYAHSMTPYCCAVCSDMFATSQDLIVHLIHHCDLNTAMKRQPQVGPRKYKRRRKLKPHELDSMASTNNSNSSQPTNEIFTVNQEEIVVQEIENNILEDDSPVRKKTRRTSRKPSTSPKPSIINDSISDSIYNSLRTIENNEAIVIPKSPTSKTTKTAKKSKNETGSSSVGARPKMIHTQKTKVAVETGEDGKVRHKTRTLVTRTQPAVSSKSGERVRPRTKNVSYHVLNPEKFPLATFAEESEKDPTQEAVDNLLKQTNQDIANGEVVTEEIVENAPYINPSEPVAVAEAEAAVPTGLVRVRDRRTSSRNSKNVIGPGSKVRLVKEGMVVSKMKRNSESLNEPESILPDNPSSSDHDHVVVKLERVFDDHSADEQEDAENVQIETISIKENYLIKHANIKQELLDPSALHELAEISMRHANADPLYKCEMCDQVFSDRAQLLIHVPVHI